MKSCGFTSAKAEEGQMGESTSQSHEDGQLLVLSYDSLSSISQSNYAFIVLVVFRVMCSVIYFNLVKKNYGYFFPYLFGDMQMWQKLKSSWISLLW